MLKRLDEMKDFAQACFSEGKDLLSTDPALGAKLIDQGASVMVVAEIREHGFMPSFSEYRPLILEAWDMYMQLASSTVRYEQSQEYLEKARDLRKLVEADFSIRAEEYALNRP